MTLESAHDAKILIVDDEPVNVLLLERILAADGYRNVRSTTDARTVLGLYRSHEPDLILLDLLMPHLDGVAVLQQLQVEIPVMPTCPSSCSRPTPPLRPSSAPLGPVPMTF